MPKQVRLKPLSRGTAAFVAAIDEVKIVPLNTCACAVIDGRVFFLAGNAYMNIPVYDDDDPRQEGADQDRELLLKHEATHLALRHIDRAEDRDHAQFNRVCDCAIHYHWTPEMIATIDRLIDGEACTYARMHLDPLPPELAYAQLCDGSEFEPEGLPPPGKGRGPEGQPGRDGEVQEGHANEGGMGEPMGPTLPPKPSEDLSTCNRPTPEELQDAYGEQPAGSDPIQDAENQAKTDQLQRDVLDGMKRDKADGDCTIPELEHIGCDHGGAEGTGVGRSETHTGTAVPAWVGELLNRLEQSCAKTERGHTWKREHREIDLLPGRGRTHGMKATIMIDASGSIDSKAMRQMLAGLASSQFGDSDVYTFDTHAYGPWLASDIKGIEGGVAKCGGGTRIAGSWDQIKDQTDPTAPRVFFSDAQDWDGPSALPKDETGTDLWVYCNWRSAISIEDTKSLYKRIGRQD